MRSKVKSPQQLRDPVALGDTWAATRPSPAQFLRRTQDGIYSETRDKIARPVFYM